jgi:non-specific serine/threonine protein kinase
MEPERWHRITEIFHAARACDAGERDRFLADACGDDTALQHDVEAMLAADHAAADLDEVPFRVAVSTCDRDRANEAASQPDQLPETIGRYRITGKIGDGGMGVVYRAVDERLNRHVALKMIRRGVTDEAARARLWREARAAASLNHPNVCQVHEIAEEDGELFVTMELLEGEPLSARVARGPLKCAEAAEITLTVLIALEALHQRGLVHRDLKPSNVFLTPHGVKLLDFGLVRTIATEFGSTTTGLTLPGIVAGTPNYMSPEQVLGQTVDGRTDLFAVGSMLFELIAGKPPFASDSTLGVLHAIVAEDPPALGGSPAVIAMDRVIRRALSKRPEARYQTADSMAHDLRMALLVPDTSGPGAARLMTRLIALPFRVLRPDPETDFLAFGLADAITNSLSSLNSLIVRSTLVASRFNDQALDLPRIATEAAVDVVLTGTLLRAGGHLRVSAQLIAVPDGEVVWSQTSQVRLGDLFMLQDDLASRIVESLSLPLTEREHRLLKHDVPATSKAYEFYLRGNQALAQYAPASARDMYLQCLDEDPQYAPAWARVGAAYRSLGKFSDTQSIELLQRSEAAFQRALQLNPDLSVAHNLYARLKIDLGHAEEAMVGLLLRARERTVDADIFAGLVQACRYCGLLEASVAADNQARRLDRCVRTSVVHTYILMGDYRRGMEVTADDPADVITQGVLLLMLGRASEAVSILERGKAWELSMPRTWTESMQLLAQGRREEALAVTQRLMSPAYRDPETFYYVARQLAYLGDRETALPLLRRAVENGFFCASTLGRDPWLDGLRADIRFSNLVRDADMKSRAARTAFLDANGDRVLGWGPH